MRLTLRTKGVLALFVLILYVAAVGIFLAQERNKLVPIVEQIEGIHYRQVFLASMLNALTHSLVDTQIILSSPESLTRRDPSQLSFPNELDPIIAGLARLQQLYPALAQDVGHFVGAVDAVRAVGDFRHLDKVRDRQQELIAKLNDIQTGLQARSANLAQNYQDKQQFISTASIAANIVGAVASMVVILIFFTRLAKALKQLQDRAQAIVAGYDGEPLANTRNDEVGGLIDAVNRMQIDLRRWEQQQEMSRQQRFHQEKMAAVGSLAAAIGHEVNNPIAAISGIAQYMIDETKEGGREVCRSCNEYATQILNQTERIASIMQHMTAMTAPHSPDPELLDLNALVRSTCNFVAFDKRLAGIHLELELDREIPAVTAVADHITQVLMNLLINAGDAMDPAAESGHARIRVGTQSTRGEIHLTVSDNGVGMNPEVRSKAFDDAFTTKPAGKGRGIGLFLCKRLMEEAGGRIELTSTPWVGTTAHLYLPLDANPQAVH